MILIFLVFGLSLVIPTFFTSIKWKSEKEYGVLGYTIWEYVRMWVWIWMATFACLSSIAALLI